MSKRNLLAFIVVGTVVAEMLSVPAAMAQVQSPPRPTQTVNVKGRAMRVWLAGIDQRKPGQPVVILEAGAGAGLDRWTPEVVAGIAQLAPVVAYDRRGVGQSEPDTVRPTIRRVGQSLHDLLETLRIPPPYVLVGASWGGALIRGFSHAYPGEVAGFVYLDALDLATREERAAVLPEADRKRALEPPTLPPIPPDTPPGLRAEYEQVSANMLNDYAEARSLHPDSGVPVAVIVASPPGRLKSDGALVRLQIAHQGDWALSSSNGLLIVSGSVGHNIQRDDPALVFQAVKHVLKNAPAGRTASPDASMPVCVLRALGGCLIWTRGESRCPTNAPQSTPRTLRH
ncbi:MAG TPA: alpha/beta hydrolase [Vicinamibacterales bacterium]|nr:alpha/beta hydrolase [Vicinamibacterales bacterium]